MTTKQKQWQLHYLGYYGDSLDYIDAKFREATRQFQKDIGIEVDGIFGPSTEAKSMEVVAAIQDVVATYHPVVSDGLAGTKTMAATIYFQKAVGLTPDGIAGKETREHILKNAAPAPSAEPESGDWWDDIEFFTRDEFKCKCGGRYCNGYPAEPQELLVRLAERARKHFKAPATIVSGLRCQRHNANEGGVANSQHMYGEACDIRIEGVSGDRLLAFFKAQPEVRYTYKINSTNVHFDIPKGKR